MQAWAGCRAGTFNLSYESLTSHKTRNILRDLPVSCPAFFTELTTPRQHQVPVLGDDEAVEEDNDTSNDTDKDSEVPLSVLLDHIHNPAKTGNGYDVDDEGRLVPTAEAKRAFAKESGEVSAEQAEEEKGRGKQKKIVNTLYSEEALKWWEKD